MKTHLRSVAKREVSDFRPAHKFLILVGLCMFIFVGGMSLKNGLALNLSKIVFSSKRDGNYEIYVMNANGKNLRNLTLHLDSDTSPTWSPDGSKIAFSSRQVAGEIQTLSDIFVMDADGANRTNITQNPRAYNRTPSWSPDGRKIAFAALRNVNRVDPWNGSLDVLVMNADGTNPVRLTEDARLNWLPSWSPDAKKIVFERAALDDPIYCDIYIMNADGTGLVNLTQTPLVGEWNPSWKPTPFSVSSRDKLQPGGRRSKNSDTKAAWHTRVN